MTSFVVGLLCVLLGFALVTGVMEVGNLPPSYPLHTINSIVGISLVFVGLILSWAYIFKTRQEPILEFSICPEEEER